MNLAKAKRDDLLGPLSAVSGIIERRHTLPILSNVLIERSGDALAFLATDIEIQIAARSGVNAPAATDCAIVIVAFSSLSDKSISHDCAATGRALTRTKARRNPAIRDMVCLFIMTSFLDL